MKAECINILQSVGDLKDPQRKVLPGEGDPCAFYDASDNKYPEGIIFANSIDEIIDEKKLASQKRFDEIKDRRTYLWVIDEERILIAPEATPATSDRGVICHTNITGNTKARIGGELWFLKKEGGEYEVHLNFASGRYGTEDDLTWEKVYQLFDCVGYGRPVPFNL